MLWVLCQDFWKEKYIYAVLKNPSILRNFRLKFGRDIVDPYVREAVIERKEIFSDIFSSELVEDFEGKDGEKN